MGVTWEWQDDTWHRLNLKDADTLEQVFCRDPTGQCCLALGPRQSQYDIDFSQMKQRSSISNRVRNLRRRSGEDEAELSMTLPTWTMPSSPPAAKLSSELSESFLAAQGLVDEASLAMAEAINQIQHSIEQQVKLIETQVGEAVVSASRMSQLSSIDFAGSCSLPDYVASGDVALIRSGWLINWALQNNVLPRRQDLPPDAFWEDVNVLQESDSSSMKVVAVSYCWYSPEHPDPDSQLLRVLARVAQMQQMHKVNGSVVGDFAIFLDWCSLYQWPRSPEQQAAFDRSLSCLGTWYASSKVMKWLLTVPPMGCAGKAYDERGWTFFERLTAYLDTASTAILDLGFLDERCQSFEQVIETCKTKQAPPLSPDLMDQILDSKTFSYADTDLPMVKEIYRFTVQKLFESRQSLDFSGLFWDDTHAEQLAGALAWYPRLAKLVLTGNRIADGGLEQIAKMLPPGLQILDLANNLIGALGAQHLAEAMSGLRNLQQLYLCSNAVGSQGADALSQSIARHSNLGAFRLANNRIGPEGAQLIASNLPRCLSIHHLSLNENGIGRGVGAIATALPHCTSLDDLFLDANDIQNEGAAALAQVLRQCTNLQNLSLNENGITDLGAASFAAVLPNCFALRTLRLSMNFISPEAVEILVQAQPTLNVMAFGQQPPCCTKDDNTLN